MINHKTNKLNEESPALVLGVSSIEILPTH
jgi:hypothetical protein